MTGALWALAAGALIGAGSSAYNGIQQRKAAKRNQALQREANALQEKQMLAQAGATPQQRMAADAEARKERARSGLRQTILTAQNTQGTKLGGDAAV